MAMEIRSNAAPPIATSNMMLSLLSEVELLGVDEVEVELPGVDEVEVELPGVDEVEVEDEYEVVESTFVPYNSNEFT